MQDARLHNLTFAHDGAIRGIFRRCRGGMIGIAVGFMIVVCVLCAMPGATFGQSGVMAPAPPMTASPYGNAVYGYAPSPMIGQYYSGNSPMLQTQVQTQQTLQPTPMQMQVLQAMQANQPGYYNGYYNQQSNPGFYDPMMTSPYAAAGYGYGYGNGSPYDAYGDMWSQQHGWHGRRYEDHMSDYEAVAEATGQSSGGYGSYMPLRSPLLETGWETAKLLSPFNAPDGPHRGVGQPFEDESWLDRPYYFGVFGGWVDGDRLVSGQIDQKSGGNGGITLGWNLNHYWGIEGRLFGSSIDIRDISNSPVRSPGRSNRLTILDASAHYYPLGEARWRPYLKLGIGYAQERFHDNYGIKQSINTWTVPVGIGLKYWWSDRVNVYGEIVDNVIFGKGPTKTHGDVALNFGVNFTFGTNPNYHPTVYWPQTPSKPY